MARDSNLELRVTRLENDTTAIYGMIGDIQSTLRDHSARFDAIDQRFDVLESRFDVLETRFDGLESRFDVLETRFDGLESRFDGVEVTLVEVLRRLPDPG